MVGPSFVQRISSVNWAGPRLVLRLHRAGLGFATVTWSQFASLVEQERPDAVTVDVFETCVVRDLAGDQAIESLAARRASAAAGHGTGGSVPRHDPHYVNAAADLELDLCRPVPDAVDGLDRVRAAVGQIVFISDTDRSSELLIEMLQRHDLFRTGDRLVASCEAGVTKSEGGLYDLIWPTRPDTVWHLGNSNWADGAQAAAHGYQPFDFPSGNLSRYEAALCTDSTGMGPVLAGAARTTRLELEYEFEHGKLDERTFQLNRLGAQVAGPAMAAFALWTASQVREHNIDHLGYLSRDGELPYLVAKRMPEPTLQATGQSYVHLNRIAVTLATAAAIGVETWVEQGTGDPQDFLLARIHMISFRGLLQRLGFEPDDIATVMGRSTTLGAHNPDRPLHEGQVEDWLTLLNAQTTQELISIRAAERRAALVDYLDQLGLLSASRPAFVDVGWRGRMAQLIDTALIEYFSNEPIHLHFGGDHVPTEVDEQVRIHRFAFPGTAKIDPFDNPPAPVETITASGSPRVIDYQRTASGSVEPIFQPETTDVGRADRAEMWRGAIAMADHLPAVARVASWELSQAPLDGEARELLRLWWYEPDRDEASAMRAFAFEGDEAGAQVAPVVAPYALSDIVGSNRTPRQWRQGSGVISPLPSKIGLQVAMFSRRLLGK